MEATRKEYQDKIEGQIKDWSSRIEALQTHAEKAAAEAKSKLLEELGALKKVEAAGRRHIASVETVAAHTWDAAKSDLSDKWNHVSGAFDAVWARVHGFSPTAGATHVPTTRRR